MLPETEAEPSAPGYADEVRALDPERIEYGDDVRDARGHRIRLGIVRLVAPTVTSMVDVDEPELIGEVLQRSRYRCVSDQLDRIEEAAEDHDRRAFAAIVFEVHTARVTSVGRV
jgi:hypothetical protein